MSNSPKKSPRRKSKRRSSFAASRINILQKEETDGGELYKDIETQKQPEERLIMLTKACLEYTLKKMESEMSGCRDFETLRREVEETTLRKIADMEISGMFKEATQKEKMLPNPINTEMDCAIEELKAKISRLNDESSTWERLIKDTETRLSEVDRNTTQISEQEVPDRVKALSGPYLRNRLDYPSLLTTLDQSCKKTNLMVYEHARIVSKMNKTFQLLSSSIEKHIEEMKELQKPVETPRRVIKSLLSFPTPK